MYDNQDKTNLPLKKTAPAMPYDTIKLIGEHYYKIFRKKKLYLPVNLKSALIEMVGSDKYKVFVV